MPGLSQYRRGFGFRKPGAWVQLDSSHQLARGMIGCWIFAEGGGGVVHDLLRLHNTTLGAGTPNWAGSPVGTSFKCNGSTYLDAGGNVFGSKVYTMYTRFVPGAVNSFQGIVSTFTSNTDAAEIFINNVGSQLLCGNIGSSVLSSPTNSINTGVWVSVWLVSTGSGTYSLYLNGSLNNTGGNAANFATFTPHTCFGARTGGTFIAANNTQISEVIIWNRALSDNEVKFHYSSPFGFLIQTPPKKFFFNPNPAAVGAAFDDDFMIYTSRTIW